VPSCTWLGGCGLFSHSFSGEVYDFYRVSPEYFGCDRLMLSGSLTKSAEHPYSGNMEQCKLNTRYK
jgi:hypothetical protein